MRLSEVIDCINSIEADDMDIEMTQEMLENMSGGMIVDAPSLRGVKISCFLETTSKPARFADLSERPGNACGLA